MLCHAVSRIGEASALRFGCLQLLGELLRLLCNFTHTLFQSLNLLTDAAASCLLLCQLILYPLNIGKAVLAVCAQDCDCALHRLRLRVCLCNLFAQTVNLHIAVVQVKGKRLCRHIELIERCMLLLQDESGRVVVLLRFARRSAQLFQRVQP